MGAESQRENRIKATPNKLSGPPCVKKGLVNPSWFIFLGMENKGEIREKPPATLCTFFRAVTVFRALLQEWGCGAVVLAW